MGILHAKPQLRLVVILAFLVLVAIYDLISLKRVHKTTLWASALVMGVMLVRIPLAMTSPWQSFATMMGGKS